MLSHCGLLDLQGLEEEEAWRRVEHAYEAGYRDDKQNWDEGLTFIIRSAVPIEFLGCWDTVGALGVPNDLSLLNLLDDSDRWRFHDTSLGDKVERARHALALDEMRASFTPTMWDELEGGSEERLKQMWFAGVHSDVGGGNAASGLADHSLKWMIDEAKDAGLAFQQKLTDQVEPDKYAVLHNSYKGAWKNLRSRPRATPPIVQGQGNVHGSAVKRQDDPPIAQAPYRPTVLLGQQGQRSSCSVSIYARDRWNDTGVYLSPGRYRFQATGEWVDKSIPCGPGGTRDGNFHLGEIVHVGSTIWGFFERGWKKLTDNDGADFVYTRRIENAPWFMLVGEIANDLHRDGNDADGSPRSHERILIGEDLTHDVELGGYLYAYANDVWSLYENNRGSVQLTVTHLP